jgi:hypothetical protein
MHAEASTAATALWREVPDRDFTDDTSHCQGLSYRGLVAWEVKAASLICDAPPCYMCLRGTKKVAPSMSTMTLFLHCLMMPSVCWPSNP